MKPWLLWFLALAVFLLAVVFVSGAVIVHNPTHYDRSSLEMAVLVTLAIETLLTLCFVIEEWYLSCRRSAR